MTCDICLNSALAYPECEVCFDQNAIAPECTQCIEGFYLSPYTYTCQPCHPLCSTCVSDGACETCLSGDIPSANGRD